MSNDSVGPVLSVRIRTRVVGVHLDRKIENANATSIDARCPDGFDFHSSRITVCPTLKQHSLWSSSVSRLLRRCESVSTTFRSNARRFWNRRPAFARFFASGIVGNVVFSLCERLVSQIIQTIHAHLLYNKKQDKCNVMTNSMNSPSLFNQQVSPIYACDSFK